MISDKTGRNWCWRNAQETPKPEEMACKMRLEKEVSKQGWVWRVGKGNGSCKFLEICEIVNRGRENGADGPDHEAGLSRKEEK